MKHKFTLRLIICLMLYVSINYETKAQNQYLSPKEAIEDLKVFIDVLDHHPGVHLYRTISEMDSLKASLNSSINDSISFDHFYLHLLQALVFIKDGHTSLSLGPKYSMAKKSTTTLPFRYKIIGSNIYIIDTLTSGVYDMLYTQIISINGITSDSILSICYQYTTADNDNLIYKKRYNERILGQNFDFFFGPYDEYEIISISSKGDTIQRTIEGIKDYETKVNSTLDKPLNYSLDEENNLAILQVKTFSYGRIVEAGQDFHKFIYHFFREVRKKEIDNLVIDVRENWGGAGGLAMGLYAYLSPEDFKWTDYSFTCLDGTEEFARFSQHPDGQYDFLKNHDTLRINDRRLKVTNGLESKSIHSSTKIPSGPNRKMKNISKNKFNRNLFILTSGITFSAGSIFASKCSELENSIIIGEPTGSASGIFCGGGYLFVSLPNSKFRLNLPVMERHIAIADENTKLTEPLKPNYLIEKGLSDFIEKVDPEMNTVYELIEK